MAVVQVPLKFSLTVCGCAVASLGGIHSAGTSLSFGTAGCTAAESCDLVGTLQALASS